MLPFSSSVVPSPLRDRLHIGASEEKTTYVCSKHEQQLDIDREGRLGTKLCDGKYYFSFVYRNIPAAPAYGVYISQLMLYPRARGSYKDFLDRILLLIRKLLNQRFLLAKLKSSLRNFDGCHYDLVDRYGIAVSQMTTDIFHLM